MVLRSKKNNEKKQGPPLNTIFYTELFFIALSLALACYAFLIPNGSLLLWLPALLVLCSSLASLSSLIYLNKGIAQHSIENILYYMFYSLILIVFRLFCVLLLLYGSFVPHSSVYISSAICIVCCLHSFFAIYALTRASDLRARYSRMATCSKSATSTSLPHRGTAPSLSLSVNTLMTDCDDIELLPLD